jgi:hypothetical protein
MIIEYLTAILVFITAIYAYLTHRMAQTSQASVEEMRRQSEATFRPYIIVSSFVRPHTPLLYLRVANTGRNAAQNLKLSIDKDFYQFGEIQSDKNLKNKSAFNTPMDSFPPDSEIIFALAQGWVLFEGGGKPDICPSQFSITASYEFSGKKVEEHHNIDLRGYLGSEGNRDPLVEELEKLRKIIEKK